MLGLDNLQSQTGKIFELDAFDRFFIGEVDGVGAARREEFVEIPVGRGLALVIGQMGFCERIGRF